MVAAPSSVPASGVPTSGAPTRGLPAGTRADSHVRTVREAAFVFVRFPSPQLLLVVGVLGVAARVVLARWSWVDVVVAAVLVAAQPFTEWLIHVKVLHAIPDGRVSRALDSAAALGHRRHHEDPYDLRWQFIRPTAVGTLVVVLTAAVLLTGSPRVATGALTAMLLALTYEWLHFLIHTDVRPRSAVYRRIHRAHRLHHYRNEAYWLGVTSGVGDLVLGTYPGKDDVPVSPTARTASAGLAAARP